MTTARPVLAMTFPVALDRRGYRGVRDTSARTGAACPVDVRMSDTWAASRGGGSRGHEGVDIFAGRGTSCLAIEDGFLEVSDGPTGGLSRRLVSTDGVRRWTYSHLDSSPVAARTRVTMGQVIGGVGTTGSAAGTCPHLHIELRERGTLVNPFARLEILRSSAEIQGDEEAEGQAREALEAADRIAAAWAASGDEHARAAAGTMQQAINAARGYIETRPDLALEAARSMLTAASRAPHTWATPASALGDLARALEGARGAVEAVATGAAMGTTVALALGLAALAWWASR